MNAVGLYLGNPLGHAFSWNREIQGCGSQRFGASLELSAFHFQKWFASERIADYDRIVLWLPRHFPSAVADVYLWLAKTQGSKIVTVTPPELRQYFGLQTPTRRDYLRLVRKRCSFRVGLFEEAVALALLEASGSAQAATRGEVVRVYGRRDQRTIPTPKHILRLR